MTRQFAFCVIALASTLGTANADHFYLYHPRPVFAQPVVAYSPVVAYQPAYAVPYATYAVTQVPVTTVSYAPGYYAPLVPTMAYSTPVYPAPVYSVPAYSTPVYGGYYGYSPIVRSRLHIHRNGSYNYHLRVR